MLQLQTTRLSDANYAHHNNVCVCATVQANSITKIVIATFHCTFQIMLLCAHYTC